MDTYKIYKLLECYFQDKTADRLANTLVSMKDAALIVIDGVQGPTGKTTLTKALNELGIRAFEQWEYKFLEQPDKKTKNSVEIVIRLNKPLR